MSFDMPPPGRPFDASRKRSKMLDTEVTDTLMGATLELLRGLREDPNRPGLKDTPERVAAMWRELTAGMEEDPSIHLKKDFAIVESAVVAAGELSLEEMRELDAAERERTPIVAQRQIPFYSICEHHLLPFHGQAHVAYLPASMSRAVGLSKLARCVRGYAARLTMQERLTTQVADALVGTLGARGVLVVVEAEHLCMSMRGVRAPGSITVTSAVRGLFQSSASARSEAMSLIRSR